MNTSPVYRLIWRTASPLYVAQWVHGLSRYATRQAAEAQAAQFARVFPRNAYLVETV